jgi:UDP-N-acetylglucosamine diphosphorylase/glucosamine-1-phosphate N-acetyltransferase
MPPLYVFEDSQVDRLYPLTYARAACELRVGALTLIERLVRNLGLPISGVFVREGLAEVVRRRLTLPVNPAISTREGLVLVNARLLLFAGQTPWNKEITPASLPPDSAGLAQGTVVWMNLSPELAAEIDFAKLSQARTLEALLPRVQRHTAPALLIGRPWDLLDHQRTGILEDFSALGGAQEGTPFPGAHLLAPEHIHIGRGVKIWAGAVLDAQQGPIIVEADAEIHAHAVITGPAYIGPRCVIRNHADIRENSTLGAASRVGGEIVNTLFLGNASKQHYGFLGQSIVGEWANLGAGTTASNLKNTYGTVRMTLNGHDEPTGRQFLGAIIADHAKFGIGTCLSTGSVIGFASHVIVPRPERFVPSFAWVTDKGVHRADFDKIEQIAGIAMQRRGAEFTAADHELFVRIAAEWSLAENYPWVEGITGKSSKEPPNH